MMWFGIAVSTRFISLAPEIFYHVQDQPLQQSLDSNDAEVIEG